ncbi:helix-turn-helix domain-containing protein [Micromonospora cathayae]|uniref:Helix-turn-helix domain-containing protein n=1 Tax=Micromonospora cathayae TaxID=3028804 RepID=A0ABY7ZPL6_9ACTN|nr:helix-turn-helix domain-containing protein [Micromonospora sp. HUAS 3]WDZ84371.1 helix-turn-helix domain-containing protein [Micromonospora sp. HUAS 3]
MIPYPPPPDPEPLAPPPDPLGPRPEPLKPAPEPLGPDPELFDHTPELLGPLLARLRLARGWSQQHLADRLCAAAGVPTLSRHEVSRWERQARVPGDFWLTWLAVVLAVPRRRLVEAAGASRRTAGYPLVEASRPRRALLALAQRWLADPHASLLPPGGPPLTGTTPPNTDADLGGGPPVSAPGLPAPGAGTGLPVPGTGRGLQDTGWLDGLRRLDDLTGGADLTGLGAYRLRRVAAAVSLAGPARRRGLLPVLAEAAQLAGWLAADAGDAAGALTAYRLGLRAASAAGDRALAGHVLGSASHLLAGAGDPHGAALLARTAYAGAGPVASAGLRALLLHRTAFAAASGGQHRAARAALTAAGRAAGRHDPLREPPWLYWLDGAEFAAMTGRTLTALGRPLPAVPLLAAGCRPGQPRSVALYGAWLARAWLQLGEVERAGELAGEALLAAVRAGSPRAAGALAEVGRRLAAHPTEPAVRRHAVLVAAVRGYLPRRVTPPAVRHRRRRPASVVA